VEKDKSVRQIHEELIPGIELMEECFNRLRQMRLARGSLDFDLPEPEILMDLEGEIDNIVRAERHVGHMMIEEFMIAANEAVAEFLTGKKVGCIYRVHESPRKDSLKEFAIFAHNLGLRVRLGEKVPPRKLAKVIEQVRGRPEERVVNHKLLRSMQQAVYSPENIGHYGLASSCYCHFTSPIRRYPDLVVHRLLGAAFTNEPTYQRTNVRGLKEIAEHTSRRERAAMQAEREMAKLYAALFMRDRIGDEFEGVVSHITKFGFFVELTEYFVEGVVHLTSLADDFYRFDEQGMRLVGKKHKKIIRIGDHVKVRVEEVRVADKEVNFELLDHYS
jgi:ribonuclease R